MSDTHEIILSIRACGDIKKAYDIERLSNASRAMAAQYKKNEEMASKIKAIIEEN